ncbi:hypothetical protein [Aeromonas salmonicida]|uniref:hypothetical protein n=1 Tax=Aeromonas salmonicida TaxID=645 RepID=UPI000B3FEA68|nr:hypothetical protein [Aeromonas salmonicida]ARW85324.1 hypothetical protein O23A_P3p0025 [Aeromonas salmonicida]
MRRSKISAAVIISMLSVGCSTPKVVHEGISGVKSDMDISSDGINRDAAIFVDRPPLDLRVINDVNAPVWAGRYTKAINASQMPFGVIAKIIADQAGVKAAFVDVDTEKAVSVSIPAGSTIQQALNMLESTTGYTAEVRPFDMSWRDQLIRTYDLNATGGKYQASMGSSESTGQTQDQGDGAKVINNISSSSTQFNNVKFEGDFYAETLKALQDTVGKEGSVSGSPLTGIIVVKAPSAVVQFTDAYMSKVQGSLRKQVRLMVRYLTFKSNLGDEKGVDWNLVYKAGDGNINFDTGGMGSTKSGATAPAKISVKASGGRLDGSEFVVNALQEQGNVTIVTEPSLTLLNNRVGEIKLVDTTEYTQNVKVQASGDNQVSTETVKGRYNEGYTFYVLPKVTEQNEIYLHLSSDFASLNGIETETINEVIQKNPSVNSTAFSQSTRLAPGETLIVNGYKQTLNKNGDKSTFGIPLLAGTSTAHQEVVETIVLITPIIVE